MSRTYCVNDLVIRVEPGFKGPGDKRVSIATPGGEPLVLSLASLGAVTRLWYENEARLYSKPWQEGGERVLRFLRDCCEMDRFETACEQHGLPEPHIVRPVAA